MRDSQISQNLKKCSIVSKELLFLKGCMHITTSIFQKLWRFHVVSHQVICPEESDFSDEFRVIGCGHGAEISSFKVVDRFTRSFGPVLILEAPISSKMAKFWQNGSSMGLSRTCGFFLCHYGCWFYGLNLYQSDAHFSSKVRQSLDLLSLSWERIFITCVQQSILLRGI